MVVVGAPPRRRISSPAVTRTIRWSGRSVPNHRRSALRAIRPLESLYRPHRSRLGRAPGRTSDAARVGAAAPSAATSLTTARAAGAVWAAPPNHSVQACRARGSSAALNFGLELYGAQWPRRRVAYAFASHFAPTSSTRARAGPRDSAVGPAGGAVRYVAQTRGRGHDAEARRLFTSAARVTISCAVRAPSPAAARRYAGFLDARREAPSPACCSARWSLAGDRAEHCRRSSRAIAR